MVASQILARWTCYVRCSRLKIFRLEGRDEYTHGLPLRSGVREEVISFAHNTFDAIERSFTHRHVSSILSDFARLNLGFAIALPTILSAKAKKFFPDHASMQNGEVARRISTGHEVSGRKDAPGPSIRASDFAAEIIVADYIEYKLGYWCPRQPRYDNHCDANQHRGQHAAAEYPADFSQSGTTPVWGEGCPRPDHRDVSSSLPSSSSRTSAASRAARNSSMLTTSASLNTSPTRI